MKKIYTLVILATVIVVGIGVGLYFHGQNAKQKDLALHYKSRIESCRFDISLYEIEVDAAKSHLTCERELARSRSDIKDAERKVKEAEDKISAKKAEIRKYEDKIRELGFRISY